jgi:hypothetical protein
MSTTHDHPTIGEAGACPECRAENIRRVEDAPHAFVLMFEEADPPAAVVIRTHDPRLEDASETAWATGCNLPLDVCIREIPLGVAIDSGVEMFRLYEGDDAIDMVDGLRHGSRSERQKRAYDLAWYAVHMNHRDDPGFERGEDGASIVEGLYTFDELAAAVNDPRAAVEELAAARIADGWDPRDEALWDT